MMKAAVTSTKIASMLLLWLVLGMTDHHAMGKLQSRTRGRRASMATDEKEEVSSLPK